MLEGATPYVLVNIKLEGENAVLSLSWVDGNPIPTLSGLGTICSSKSSTVPAPNWSCKVALLSSTLLLLTILVANLLETFFQS